VYRARAGLRNRVDKLLDDAAVYAATLYPVLYWHADLKNRNFVWFVEGDFVGSAGLMPYMPYLKVVWAAALLAFFWRSAVLFRRTGVLQLGKLVVVSSTAAIWYVGIVLTNNDFAFTVTNVIVHGVPYLGLLWAYGSAQLARGGASLGRDIVARGPLVFLGFLLLLAFMEELLWDRLVWQEKSWLFGASDFVLSPGVLGYVVPLLMLPQATHYVLDGMLWRRHDTRLLPAQRAALGFREHSPARG
jgi:hypothetical protein